MNPVVLVVNANQKEANGIGDLLRPEGYTPCIIDNLEGVEHAVAANGCLVVLLDLDSLKVSNRAVRQMTVKFPLVRFLCTSRRPFHPELEDAIGFHFYACMQKPVDPDELLYWMKCIHHNMEEKA
jgi:DNA-binding NtrC family response regulator